MKKYASPKADTFQMNCKDIITLSSLEQGNITSISLDDLMGIND